MSILGPIKTAMRTCNELQEACNTVIDSGVNLQDDAVEWTPEMSEMLACLKAATAAMVIMDKVLDPIAPDLTHLEPHNVVIENKVK